MPQSTEKKIPPLPPLELLSPHEAAIVRQRWDGDPFIPTPKGYALESEATAYFKAADVPNSPYFPQFDFYHMYSHGSLSMLPCFRTYQQTRGYTCASAIALMTLYHFGVTDWEELQIADKMVSKLLSMRIFEDENGKTNLDLKSVYGELMIVSQFTLCADVSHGNRPSFIAAAKPDAAIPIYEHIISECIKAGFNTKAGIFGADMKVELINDGPFTIVLDSSELKI